MRTGIISFTDRGARLCQELYERFLGAGDDCQAFVPARFLKAEWEKMGVRALKSSALDWAEEMFSQKRALVFVGATGIAVRAIAPWVKDKLTDPPVVVMDELGHFAIPLLSGHVGGANELALQLAGWVGAVPVITTATDINGLFAGDVFAARNKLEITDRQAAKAVSASLLEGRKVGFFDDFRQLTVWKGLEDGKLPVGFVSSPCRWNVWITLHRKGERMAALSDTSYLCLVPRAVVLGVGCRKGIGERELTDRVRQVLEENHIDESAVKALATIDIKRQEPAITALAAERGWQLRTYSADELSQVAGSFEESEFVRAQVKVGNVCERAACAGGGRLILHKQAGAKITVAAALELSL